MLEWGAWKVSFDFICCLNYFIARLHAWVRGVSNNFSFHFNFIPIFMITTQFYTLYSCFVKFSSVMLKRDKSIQEWRSKVFGRQHLKNLKLYGQVIFLKAVFHKFYLVVHSWIITPKYYSVVSFNILDLPFVFNLLFWEDLTTILLQYSADF